MATGGTFEGEGTFVGEETSQKVHRGETGPLPAPGRPSLLHPAPSPTKDTKLVLSMRIQTPKQKIRLPRT